MLKFVYNACILNKNFRMDVFTVFKPVSCTLLYFEHAACSEEGGGYKSARQTLMSELDKLAETEVA